MRILLITHWFPPIVSGSSFYAKSLAEALGARGHEVTIITLDWGEDPMLDSSLPFQIHRLRVVKVPRLPFFYNLKLMGFAFTSANRRRLIQLIRQNRPHIIHCVNHIFDTNFLAVSVGRTCGIPVVGSITTPVQHQNPWLQKLYHWADVSTIGWFGVRRWDGIVSLDQTVHRYVGRVYGTKVQKKSEVIPFGVRLESAPLYENPSPRSSRPQILMVGHIHPFRNPTELIRAMPYVLKEVPDARLILAGRVDLAEPLKVSQELGLTKNQIEFLGEAEHSKTIHLMKTSHVFASWVTGPYPSLGTAPMEAMLCETPVICDVPENLFGEGRLKDGENIVLVNSKDPQAIAKDLIRLLKSSALRERIGRAGRRLILESFSWEHIAEEMELFYKKFLEIPEERRPLLARVEV